MRFSLRYLWLLTLATLSLSASDRPARDWENPAVFKRNQEEPHATLAPFGTYEEALAKERKSSPFCQSLNGTWRFSWAAVPEEAPAEFHRPDFDDSRWLQITVPSNWQMQGFGDPLFRNVNQPFPAKPPSVPSDYNPVGSYRRTFTLPDAWKGRQIFLHFEGVHSASYVWVNGKEVGYNEGGMEPAEYNITAYLTPGENLLAVQVLQYSDGTYLECQDMWRLSGIFRDVYLMATPTLHIRDFAVTTDLDQYYRDAILRVAAEVRSYAAAPMSGYRLQLRLFDASRKPVLATPVLSQPLTVLAGQTAAVKLEQKVLNPAKWSSEFPNLYALTLELVTMDGRPLEAVAARIGFREVEIKNQAIYVNGIAVKFNGVNSHMQHPATGHAMDIETIRKDLALMKQFNINCVRTSHYPPNVEYLDTADEMGMYIVDEVGDEAHATEYLSKELAWRGAYVDRAVRMVKRDRNHPSVVFWSAGNESGSGDNIAAVIAEGKKIDPSRPAWCYGGNDDLLPFEGIVGPRYPTPDELVKVGQVPVQKDPRPSFMDEYLAVSGNGGGNLDEFWEVIYRFPRLTGGAIWDWPSPGISARWITTPDRGPRQIQAALMGRAQLVEGRFGQAVALSGHDQWVEVYRDPSLDVAGDSLTLEAWVYPREWNGTAPFITKGGQYGLVQSERRALEFYILDGQRISAKAPLPDDWERRWHHVVGSYDGAVLEIYLDGQVVGATGHRGRITNTAFPVNVGRDAEKHGMEHPGQLSNAVIDQVRVYPVALSPDDLKAPDEQLVKRAALALDFDETTVREPYFWLGIGARPYGLIWPDRTPQPELWQVKKVPQPVKIEAIDLTKGLLRVTNRYQFKSLRELSVTWQITGDDQVVDKGSLSLNVPAGVSKDVKVGWSSVKPIPGAQYRLLVSLQLPQATAWAPAGHEVAWEQFDLPVSQPAPRLNIAGQKELVVENQEQAVVVSGAGFRCRIDKRSGELASLEFEGEEMLKEGLRLDAWRAPLWNETERDWGGKPIVDEWRKFGLDRLQTTVESVDVTPSKEKVEVRVVTRAAAPGASSGLASDFTYTFLPTGDILVAHRVKPFGETPRWLPKIGMRLTLRDAFQTFSWYGRGPAETYPDRKSGMKIGVYSGTVDEQYSPYLVPEDYGNKTDVRWAAVSDGETGLFVSGDNPLNVSAHHFSADNLSRALYTPQLQKQDGVTLNIDYQVAGVGDTPRKTLAKYQVKPGEYRYTVRIRPYGAAEKPVELGRQALFPASPKQPGK